MARITLGQFDREGGSDLYGQQPELNAGSGVEVYGGGVLEHQGPGFQPPDWQIEPGTGPEIDPDAGAIQPYDEGDLSDGSGAGGEDDPLDWMYDDDDVIEPGDVGAGIPGEYLEPTPWYVTYKTHLIVGGVAAGAGLLYMLAKGKG